MALRGLPRWRVRANGWQPCPQVKAGGENDPAAEKALAEENRQRRK
jgi:hypothetical protein